MTVMARPLSLVPDVPPRAVGYIRVSKEREEMVSPELQLTAIKDYCAKRGYQLVHVLEDLDRTGRFWKGRKIEQAIQMIEAGDADKLVVWKGSRVARNRKDWIIAVDRVETAGGHLESATEELDTTTSTGRFTRGMLAEMAVFESERMGEQWRETHMRRLNAGLPHTGKAKWGYIYNPVKKIHEPDPETGPVLAALYQRYIDGESVYMLVRWLNANGYRTLEGNTWRDSVLRRVLATGFAAGILTYNGQTFPGAHERLIDDQTWSAYQRVRAQRAVTPSRTVRSEYLLSGLIRCACGAAMTAGQYGTNRKAKYRCSDSKERGAHDGGGYVMASFVESAVLEWLQLKASLVDSMQDAAVEQRARKVRTRSNVERIAREINNLDDQLAKLTKQHIAGVIPQGAYVTVRDELGEQRADLAAELSKAENEANEAGADTTAVAKGLLGNWDVFTVVERRNILKALIDKVIVTTGRPRATIKVVPK